MLKSWEAAYIAGMIDSEGTISLKKITNNQGNQPVITITSSDLNMLVFIQSILPGSLYSKKVSISNKEIYRYTIEIKHKENVYYALNQIKPYLRVEKKKKQVNQVLDTLKSNTLYGPKKARDYLYVLERA
ncbi:LAGLIDADG family homing endonuclease [Piscibacillus sp. B03]|uniref:LAGLIDADG family homing endonuclease n=1 Tax=Piscibacillus sp. B03 TaxID=3457430 RepID=UPI003FCE824A